VVYVIEAKTGKLTAADARRELDAAIKNRGAAAGVLVFDGVADAPLGGRSYLPHGDGGGERHPAWRERRRTRRR
jgi:hypothetical protein